MITLIITVLLILFCIKIILNLNGYLIMIDDENVLPFLDALAIILLVTWLFYQAFLNSGPFVVLSFLLIVSTDLKKSVKWKIRRRYLFLDAWLIILCLSFIEINILYLDINYWRVIFNFFKL